MLTSDRTKLLIFENFRIDEGLPKFRRPANLQAGAVDRDSMRMGGVGFARRGEVGVIARSGGDWVPWYIPWYTRLWQFAVGLWTRLFLPPPEVTIPALFDAVKMTALELKMLDKVDLGYTEAIERAKANRQTALVEELIGALASVRAEAQLLALGHARYLTEEAVVEFALNCPKGLRLDWVENFVRTIPGEITDKKVQLDTRGLFDNYVVLHYDPGVKAYRETEAQKAARRDPILFGVMRGRRRLYFVGDWIDDVCDLTWDQIAAQIGAEKTSALALEALMPKREEGAGISLDAPKSEQA